MAFERHGGYKSFVVKASVEIVSCANAKKKCRAKKGLKRDPKGKKFYCPAHMPGQEKKFKAAAKEAGKASGRTRRENGKNQPTLDIEVEGNKASIVKTMIAQANFLGKGLKRSELRKHRLLIDLMDRIHEHALEEGDEEIKQQKVTSILASKLPDTIKLSKLVDLVGADEAMKMIPVEIERHGYEDTTIDGQKLLEDAGKDGEATIGKPQSMTYAEGEGDETADVSEPPAPLAVPEPTKAEDKKRSEEPPPPALPTPETSPPQEAEPVDAPPSAPSPAPSEVPKETPEERASRCYRQGRELMGLYRKRVSGSFQPPAKIAKKFHDALLEGLPFNKLQERINHPKSAGDQPDAMISDVKKDLAPTP